MRGACFNVCDTVSAARRETSHGSALDCATWSKTAVIRSPKGTVLGVSVGSGSCSSVGCACGLLFCEWRGTIDIHIHQQQNLGHQLVANDFGGLNRRARWLAHSK